MGRGGQRWQGGADFGGDEMIWYFLFSFVVLLVLAIVSEGAENSSRGLILVAGFCIGVMFVAGLVIQYG